MSVHYDRALNTLHQWVRTHTKTHILHHENGKDHRLHFNLADMKDVLVKFRDDHPRYGKVLMEHAEREGKI